MEPESRSPGMTSFHVHRLTSGDQESFAWLVERLSPLLLVAADKYMSPAVRSIADPEDVVMDVWSKFMEKIATYNFRTESRLTPALVKYLEMIVQSSARDLASRSEVRRRQQPAAAAPGDSVDDPTARFSDSRATPLGRAVCSEEAAKLAQVIRTSKAPCAKRSSCVLSANSATKNPPPSPASPPKTWRPATTALSESSKSTSAIPSTMRSSEFPDPSPLPPHTAPRESTAPFPESFNFR